MAIKKQFMLGILLMPTLFYMTSTSASWWPLGKGTLGAVTSTQAPLPLSNQEISQGFKDALQIASNQVVTQLGQTNGFYHDPAIRIPLPDKMAQARNMLAKIGLAGSLDDLELKLNRAAEQASPKAKALFVRSINEMTFNDVQTIYNGPKDSATRYFQTKMSPALRAEMSPVVSESLNQVGAIQSYDKLIAQYQTIPFMPDIKQNLTNHVLEKGMAGMFYYLAKEEAAIRQNPAKQTTTLLKRVFGSP